MLFMEPKETAWDLRWRMFGIPVRVHPMFWLITAVMGSNALDQGVQYLLAWIACVFVSILIHELGHMTMGRLFGSHGHVVLYGFGGLAVGSNQLASRWQRMAVCFAGPLAGFVFLGVVFGALALHDPEVFPAYIAMAQMDLGIRPTEIQSLRVLFAQIQEQPLVFSIVSDLIFVNLLWGLVNLLPVWPLDGGQISRDVCDGVMPEGGLNLSLGISLVTAGLLALHSVLAMNGRAFLPLPFGSGYTALFFGLLAFQSFQLLQQAHAQRRWTDRHEEQWTDRHEDREDY